jgi:hypothetical protein
MQKYSVARIVKRGSREENFHTEKFGCTNSGTVLNTQRRGESFDPASGTDTQSEPHASLDVYVGYVRLASRQPGTKQYYPIHIGLLII